MIAEDKVKFYSKGKIKNNLIIGSFHILLDFNNSKRKRFL